MEDSFLENLVQPSETACHQWPGDVSKVHLSHISLCYVSLFCLHILVYIYFKKYHIN